MLKSPQAAKSAQIIKVLLVDDQVIVGESVRRMLATEKDIELHFCQDPSKALDMAKALEPSVILQDLIMPDVDGLMLVKFFRIATATKNTPMIVLSSKEEPIIKAEAFKLGANDYLVKLPDKIELIARIRYHAQAYYNYLDRIEAYNRLEESERVLAAEMGQAARYAKSLLPARVDTPYKTDWRFVPSMHLGGDMFGYHAIDADHHVIFLLDVSGHGVGSSLLAVSAFNVITAQALANTDFRDPAAVLKGLNKTFQMEKQDNKYFTIFYGVYCLSRREITYGNAAHPSALLYTGSSQETAKLKELESQALPIGMIPDYEITTDVVKVDEYARMLVYSDGAFEIDRPGIGMWEYHEFIEYMAKLSPNNGNVIEQLLTHVRTIHQSDSLDDDFSMLEVVF